MYNFNLRIKLEFVLVMLMGLTLVFTSCSKDKDDDPTPTPSNPEMTIDLGLIYGTQTLNLNSTSYTNAAGEQFTLSKFKFYLSNVSLSS